MGKEITGLLTTKKDVIFFREDHFTIGGFIGWSIYDTSDRPTSIRWTKFPKGEIEYFDGDNPPPTVRYIPEIQ